MKKTKKNSLYWHNFLVGLKPDEILTVSEWSDKYRKLSSKASAEAGSWRTDRTPYLREIMDSLSTHSSIEEIVFMKGAQVGGSESGFNWIGYVIDQSPGPMLMVQPTVDLAKRVSKQRIDPMIDECPTLKKKLKSSKSRDSGNTQLSKEFPGGILLLAGANAASGLRSMPIRYLFLDEEDAYPLDVEGEGSPSDLAKARTRTFNRRKIFRVSTPTISGQSAIEAAFEESDRRYFHVPCPECNQLQPLKFKNLTWESGNPQSVQYACDHCGVLFQEHNKTWMLSKGKWIAENPESKIAGFHLSSLYSPLGWFSWADIVTMWEKAQKSQEALKTFVNTILGETWKERSELPEWKKIYARKESYGFNEIPDRVLFLTAAIDVQGDRLECEIKGWGRHKENWSIDRRIWMGNPNEDQVWTKASALLGETWQHPTGGEVLIKMLAVDSGGHSTQKVYDWGRKQDPRRVMIVKGSSSSSPKSIIETCNNVEMDRLGKRVKIGLKLWTIGTQIAKSELYSWLKHDFPTESEILENGFPPGFCHYPQYDEEFFLGLTAEQLVAKKVKGFTHYYWEKIRDRNEPIDLHVYNRAAANQLGIDRYSEMMWNKLESELGVKTIPKAIEAEVVSPVIKLQAKKAPRIKKKSSFWS